MLLSAGTAHKIHMVEYLVGHAVVLAIQSLFPKLIKPAHRETKAAFRLQYRRRNPPVR